MLWLFLPLVTAMAPPAEEPPPPPTPIIDGTFDPGDPAVVGLAAVMGAAPDCTGTLITRRLIVTAGHCVELGGPTVAYFGSDPVAGGSWRPVRNWMAHPAFEAGTLENDIAVLLLDADAPAEIDPVPLAEDPPAVGQEMRFVGFGYTEVGPGGEYGRKYTMTTTVTELAPTAFKYGVATCNGDSGGPAFARRPDGREVLAGVTSWGDGPCASFGWDTRVDAYRGWILEQVPECAGDGLCSSACMIAGADPDCPAACAAEGTCFEECPFRDPDCPPPLPDGADCSRDFECEGVCDEVCRPLCDGAAPMCPDGLVCREALPSGKLACLDGGGGCAAAGGRARGGVAAWLLPAAVIALLGARRRARRVPLLRSRR